MKLSDQAKALLAGPVAVVSYFIGIIPAEGGFGDLSTVQWLGAIPILAGVYGIVYAVPDARSKRIRKLEADPGPLREH